MHKECTDSEGREMKPVYDANGKIIGYTMTVRESELVPVDARFVMSDADYQLAQELLAIIYRHQPLELDKPTRLCFNTTSQPGG
jgi:hypothetical protein